MAPSTDDSEQAVLAEDRQAASAPNGEDSQQPLLSGDRHALFAAGNDREEENGNPQTSAFTVGYNKHRQKVQAFLSSKSQHYCVLSLVSLDLLGIFADIFLNLYVCEEGEPSPKIDEVRNGLGIMGLVFSCIFMIELILSVWAFGWRYFQSWFHVFDGTVIFAGFFVDVVLHGVLEEIASLVVLLRLWRFFKIIEEFSVGAQEQMDGLELRIEQLETENQDLKSRLNKSKGSDEEAEIGSYKRRP